MGINKIRNYGNRAIPTLKDKVQFTDIVNDVTTGGTGMPLSAEMGKKLATDLANTTGDSSQAITDLKGDVTAANDTLGKIETNLNAEIANRVQAITDEVTDRDAAILVEETRAKATELVNANDIATETTSRQNDVANLTSKINTDIAAEKTRAEGIEAGHKGRLDTLESADTVSGSVAYAVLGEKTRSVAEEARIEAKGDQEKLDRIAADTAVEAYADAAVLAEKTRAEGIEAANTTAITNEVTTRSNEITRVDTDISTLSGVVATNNTTITDALAAEAATRLSDDTTLSDRMAAVEGTLVGGVSWKGSVADLAGIDNLVEADLVAGQAYYVSAEKDVYVVLPDQGGDYVPSTFSNKSFLKIADFAELTGLVTAEKNRALAAESANNSAIITEATTRGTEITRVEGLLTTEATRAGAAEVVNANAISQLDADYKSADTAMTAAYIAADLVVDNRVTTEVATLNSTITSNDSAINTALTNEINRATTVETANTGAIATLNADNQTAGSVDSKVKVETTRALSVEDGHNTRITIIEGDDQTVGSIKEAVLVEKTRSMTSEGIIDAKVIQEISDRIADVDAEELRATTEETAIVGRVDIIEGDDQTVGSIKKAQLDAQAYADKWIPRCKLEVLTGTNTISGDEISVTYAPMPDGVVMGEVIVYGGDNDSEALSVNVASISGTTIKLDVVTAGEFDGKECKVFYMFLNADQTGASQGAAGSGGAGA
jgi:hypothetical protein